MTTSKQKPQPECRPEQAFTMPRPENWADIYRKWQTLPITAS